MLVRLDNIEVRTFTLRHAVLSVKLKLSSDNRVFTPAVKLVSGFCEDKGTSVRDSGTTVGSTSAFDRPCGMWK